MSEIVKLTIVTPADQELKLVEALLESPLGIGGFTTFPADGHGQSFAGASVAERVKGRTARMMLTAVLPHEKASATIQFLKSELRLPQTAWWLEPVMDFGTTS